MYSFNEELQIIKNFVRIMAERSGGSHNLGTALISALIAMRMDLSPEKLYISGLLHDIGAIGIFENFISEPLFFEKGQGYDEELTYHPEVSYRMVKELLGLDLIAIKEHHELLNGQGYPIGLSGEDVSIEGYVLGIADKLEVLARSKEYNYHEIIKTIREWENKWYPSSIIDASMCLLIEDRSILYDIQQAVSLERRINECEKNFTFPDFIIDEKALLKFFSMSITLKHPYTSYHAERVSGLALKIGERIGLDKEAMRNLEISAYLHDIGKVCIPRAVLDKPYVLEPSEVNIIKEHVLKTYEILNNSPITEEVAFISSSHHEAMDGSGYPLGLKGEEIPILSRIINVVDIFDALTSSRAYRPALSLRGAVKTMEEKFYRKIDYDLFNILKVIIREENNYGL
ncbi:MAG: HD-GYP domain-containing protein [Thermodesulfovibrionales bacterium]